MRVYYYAIPGNGDKWHIHSSVENLHTEHDSKESALLAAKALCRRHWEERGTPCGLRVRIDAEQWEDHELYGPDALEADATA